MQLDNLESSNRLKVFNYQMFLKETLAIKMHSKEHQVIYLNRTSSAGLKIRNSFLDFVKTSSKSFR